MAEQAERVTLTEADVGVLDLGEQTPEKIIRSIERRCRGPLAEGAREEINRLLAEGDLEAARALEAKSRQGCGQDWNEVILAHPLDGQTRETPCPKCGTVVRWTAPVF